MSFYQLVVKKKTDKKTQKSKLWNSPIAQLVKNLATMQETQVRFLGQKDPLEKGEATHSCILA